jgi:hypothetical protein
MNQSEINAANCASAEREAQESWTKEQQIEALRVEEQFGHKPRRPLYHREHMDKQEFLAEIVAANIKASRQ